MAGMEQRGGDAKAGRDRHHQCHDYCMDALGIPLNRSHPSVGRRSTRVCKSSKAHDDNDDATMDPIDPSPNAADYLIRLLL